MAQVFEGKFPDHTAAESRVDEGLEADVHHIARYQGNLAVNAPLPSTPRLVDVDAVLAHKGSEDDPEREVEDLVALVQVLGEPLKPDIGESKDDFEAREIARKAARMEAFEDTMRLTIDNVRRLVHGFFPNDEHTARDIVQETYLSAYRSIGKFRGDSKLETWLYRIASNRCKTHLGRRNREGGRGYHFERQQLESSDHSVMDRLNNVADSDSGSSLRSVERKADFGAGVHQALSSLQPARRRVVVLRALTGLSNTEAAKILGIKPGTCKVRYSEGLSQLRKILGKDREYRDWDTD